MRRFWLPFARSLAMLVVLWNLCFHFFPREIYGPDYVLWKAKFDLIRSEKEAPRVLILGDSSAVSSIHATDTKRKTLNLGIACGGAVEASLVYESYREKLPAPRIVVIYVNDIDFRVDRCFTQQLLAFDQITFWEKASILSEFREGGRRIPVFDSDEKFFDVLHVPHVLRDALYVGLLSIDMTPIHMKYARNVLDFEGHAHQRRNYEKTIEQRGFFLIGNLDSSEEVRTIDMEPEAFVPNPVILRRFENLMTKLTADGSTVVVRLTPWSPPNYATFTDRYKREFKAYLDGVAERFPTAHVEREIRVWPTIAYGDHENHLNSRGALMESAHLEAFLDRVDP